MKPAIRSALSLLEVVLAIGILTACAILLGELVGIGRRHADAARDLTEAQNLCENRLAEMLSGVAPLERVDGVEIPEAPDWTYSVRIQPVPDSKLRAVTVSVRGTETVGRRTPEYSITRWTVGGVGDDEMSGTHLQGINGSRPLTVRRRGASVEVGP